MTTHTLPSLAGGLALAASLVLTATTALPRSRNLATHLDTVTGRTETPPPAINLDEPELGPLARLGRFAAPALTRAGLPRPNRTRDLTLLGRAATVHVSAQAGAALFTTAVGAGLWLILTLGSIPVPAPLAVPAIGLLGLGGLLLPVRQLARDAAAERTALRQAAAAYLGLAAMMMAAGSGIEQALHQAAARGSGTGFARLRTALAIAQSTREPLFPALSRLGHDADVRELVELAACANLAGTEGARIRASITTKAATLRQDLLTAQETAANQAAERAAIPTVLITLGYLLLIAYPALSRALTAL